MQKKGDIPILATTD